MWHDYLDGFPADKLQEDLNLRVTPPPSQLQVCYIDRQDTLRPLPAELHDWLINFDFTGRVYVRHLHMEQLTALEQMMMVAQCHVLLGGHGNGLTHLFWMSPRSFVVEIFWNFDFHFDYATSARMMHHEYLGIMNGEIINGGQVSSLDGSLLWQLKGDANIDLENSTLVSERIQQTKKAI